MSNPTQFLPTQIKSCSSIVISDFVSRLTTLYRPRLHNRVDTLKSTAMTVVDSGYSSEAEDEETDVKFERNYSKTWLLNLVRQSEDWIERGLDARDVEERMAIIERVAALMAFLFETSESGAIHRTVLLPREANDVDPISITLLDALPSNDDATSVGLQSWGASIILSRRMALDPSRYNLAGDESASILELGAGTGLLSLACAKLREGRDDVILATDYHAAVLENLRRNVEDNELISPSIVVKSLDWSHIHALVPSSTLPAPFNQRFDLVIGGDVVYRALHSEWLHSTVSRFLAYPTSSSSIVPLFILIAPLRPTHIAAIASITQVFPHRDDLPPRKADGEYRLAIVEMEEAVREFGVGREDERGYRIFRISWV